MAECLTYVGLDVHKRSIAGCLLETSPAAAATSNRWTRTK